MDMLLGALSAVFWGVLLLSILVFVHEGGHYIAARAFGVRVTEFYLGMPCRFKWFHKSRSHGTEVGVTPILLGGYNRICGMEGEPDELLSPAFAIVQREGRVTAEALAGELGVDIDRAYALLICLSDMASIRPYYDPTLDEYPTQKEYPAAFETIARDANMLTEYDSDHDFLVAGYTADAQPRPLTDPDAALEHEVSHTYRGLSVPKRLVVLAAGPLVNLVLAFALTTSIFLITDYTVYVNKNVIGDVVEGSLAEQAGLLAGDTILSVGDTPTEDWEVVSDALGAYREAGEDFTIAYERDGVEATAVIDMPEGEDVELIGVNAPVETFRLTLGEAMQAALDYTGLVLGTVVKLIMPQHTMEVLNQSSSIVGISVAASEAAASGAMDVIALMAAISMSLGFMNLLPIPPLDGGKILIEFVQVCIRRTLSLKAQTTISYVGLAFFAFVFVVVVRNDVVRLMFG